MESKEMLKAKAKSRILMLSLFSIIFIFIFIFSVSAFDISTGTEVQSVPVINAPDYNFQFNDNGFEHYMLDSNGNITKMTTSTYLDLTSIARDSVFHLPAYPTTPNQPYGIIFVLADQQNVYITLQPFILGTNTFPLRHYLMTSAGDLSTLTLMEEVNITGFSNSAIAYGIFVTGNGRQIILNSCVAGSSGGTFVNSELQVWNMPRANNLTGINLNNSISNPDFCAFGSGVGFPNYHQQTGIRTLWFSADGYNLVGFDYLGRTARQYVLFQPFNVSSMQQVSNITFSTGGNGQTNSGVIPTLYQVTDKTYMLFNNLNTYEKYQVSGLLTNFTLIQTNENVSNTFITSVITPILSLFPDKDTLTTSQRYGYVFVVMIITAIIILFAGGSLNKGISPILLWITLIIEIALFFFFISLHYIGYGALIILTLIGVAISYFKFKGTGGS